MAEQSSLGMQSSEASETKPLISALISAQYVAQRNRPVLKENDLVCTLHLETVSKSLRAVKLAFFPRQLPMHGPVDTDVYGEFYELEFHEPLDRDPTTDTIKLWAQVDRKTNTISSGSGPEVGKNIKVSFQDSENIARMRDFAVACTPAIVLFDFSQLDDRKRVQAVAPENSEEEVPSGGGWRRCMCCFLCLVVLIFAGAGGYFFMQDGGLEKMEAFQNQTQGGLEKIEAFQNQTQGGMEKIDVSKAAQVGMGKIEAFTGWVQGGLEKAESFVGSLGSSSGPSSGPSVTNSSDLTSTNASAASES